LRSAKIFYLALGIRVIFIFKFNRFPSLNSAMPTKYILIVDDDPDDREILESALFDVGSPCVCRTARDGEHAFRILEEYNRDLPDLIFLDLNMPRMGGIEFLRRLKAMSNYANVPVIVYTTSSLQLDIDVSFKYGAAHFITKPKTYKALCAALNDIFKYILPLAGRQSNLHIIKGAEKKIYFDHCHDRRTYE
jgi:CheY-like chemotaxis protein